MIVGAVLGLGALALAFRDANLEKTIALIRQHDLSLSLLAFVAVMAATAARIRRWQVMLRPNPTRYGRLFGVFLVAHLLSTLLPAKVGMAARVYLASDSERLNGGLVLGTVAAETFLDTLVMLLLLLGLVQQVPLPFWLRDALSLTALGLLLTFVGLISIRRSREMLSRLAAKIEGRFSRAREWHISAALDGLIDGCLLLFQRKNLIALWVYTGLLWLAGGLANQFLLNAMGIQVPWTAAWFLLPVLQIGTRVPSLPANIGVFHYLVVLALDVYGVDGTAALGYALVLHLLVFILPAILGALCVGWIGIRPGGLVRAQEGAVDEG